MIETLQWEPLFTMRLHVDYPNAIRVGDAPAGRRGIFPVVGGAFEGPRLRGKVLHGGADWVQFRGDETMMIDVRTALETDDGALISMAYVGLAWIEDPDKRARFYRQEVVDYADTYVRTTPRFETADPRYDWLNRVIAVANGARTAEGPRYEVFAIR